MSDDGQIQSPTAHRRSRSAVREIKLTVTISERDLRDLLAALQQPIIDDISAAVAKLKEVAGARPAVSPPAVEKAAAEKPVGGINLPDAERLKAADLRTGLLLGKVPDTAGLMIDKKTMARLLNVSLTTLHQLHATESIPEAVRLGRSIIRWRLAEILAWMEAGCPSRRNWTYSSDSEKTKVRR